MSTYITYSRSLKTIYKCSLLALELERFYCGEPFQVWEMWLSPHSEKPVGSKVGRQNPHPWIGSPVGNQACIVPRLLRLALAKTPSP